MRKRTASLNVLSARQKLKRVTGLGVVPLSEIEDVPLLPDENPDRAAEHRNDEFCSYETKQLTADSARAPC